MPRVTLRTETTEHEEVHEQELRTYDTSRGTIRFQPSKPLPVPLIQKVRRVRLQELA